MRAWRRLRLSVRLDLPEVEGITVATYIEQLGNGASEPTVKEQLAAIRQVFDYLIMGDINERSHA